MKTVIMYLVLSVISLALYACSGEIPKEIDGKILCSVSEQKAYLTKDLNYGENVTVYRAHDSDVLCQR